MTLPALFTAYVVLVAAATAIVAGVWLTRRAALVTIGFLVGWLAFAGWMGASGLAGQYDRLPPGLALLAGPVVATLLVLSLTGAGGTLALRIPLRLLLGFQVFRVGVEFSLHRLATMGLAPKMMTLEGGNVELLVAATAPVAAWLVSPGSTGRRASWVWNLIGLLSLANIVTRAVLSAPGPLHLIHAEVPDTAILNYPFTFIPGFMAPLAMTLHILAFRALRADSDASTRVS